MERMWHNSSATNSCPNKLKDKAKRELIKDAAKRTMVAMMKVQRTTA